MGVKDNSLFEKKNENGAFAQPFRSNAHTTTPPLPVGTGGVGAFTTYDWNDLSTANKLVRLSATPPWATFSVAEAPAVVSTL